MNETNSELQHLAVDTNRQNISQMKTDGKPVSETGETTDDHSTDNEFRMNEMTTNCMASVTKAQKEFEVDRLTPTTPIQEEVYLSAQNQFHHMQIPPRRAVSYQTGMNAEETSVSYPTCLFPSKRCDEISDVPNAAPPKEARTDDDDTNVDDVVKSVISALTKKQKEFVDIVAQSMLRQEENSVHTERKQQSSLISSFATLKSANSSDDSTMLRNLDLLSSCATDHNHVSDSQYPGLDWDALRRRNRSRKKYGLGPLSPNEFLEIDSPPTSPSPYTALGHQDDNDDTIILEKRSELMSPSAENDKQSHASKYTGIDWDAFERKNKSRKKFGLSPLSPEEFLVLDSPPLSPSPPYNNSKETSMQSATVLPSFKDFDKTKKLQYQRPSKKLRFDESFPMILHRLLNDLNNVKHGTEIAVYDDFGSAFNILDDEAFEEIMTMYFPRLKSFSTFRLQLKIYGFNELSNPLLNSFTFSHPQFHRDRPLSVAQMEPRNITVKKAAR